MCDIKIKAVDTGSNGESKFGEVLVTRYVDGVIVEGEIVRGFTIVEASLGVEALRREGGGVGDVKLPTIHDFSISQGPLI